MECIFKHKYGTYKTEKKVQTRIENAKHDISIRDINPY